MREPVAHPITAVVWASVMIIATPALRKAVQAKAVATPHVQASIHLRKAGSKDRA